MATASQWPAMNRPIAHWLPVIAAMIAERKQFHKIDYVPCYRSEAGTGNAMAFVYWQ